MYYFSKKFLILKSKLSSDNKNLRNYLKLLNFDDTVLAKDLFNNNNELFDLVKKDIRNSLYIYTYGRYVSVEMKLYCQYMFSISDDINLFNIIMADLKYKLHKKYTKEKFPWVA